MREQRERAEDFRDFERLVGSWEGIGSFRNGDTAAPTTIRWTVERTAGGAGLLGKMVIDGLPGRQRCVATDLLGVDHDDGNVHWLTICDAHEAHDRRGSWRGDSLEVANDREHLTARVVSSQAVELRWRLRGGAVVEFQLTRLNEGE